MPLPIDIIEQALGQYLALFRRCFSRPQWQHFVTVLLAMMQCDEQRTLSALLRQIAGVGTRIDGLSRFLKDAPWQAQQVVACWWRHFCEVLESMVAAEHIRQRALRPRRPGRPRKTVVTGFLIVDDSTHEKRKGKRMEGLGYHSSSVRKTVKGHSLFACLYVLLGRRCPLMPALYRQQAVCEREGVAFKSKIDLAEEQMCRFEPVAGTRTHVLMDSWYTCRRLWRLALARGWAITGGLKANRKMRVEVAKEPGVQGAGSRMYVTLPQYAASLRAEAFTDVGWPHEDGTMRPVYAHLVKTFVRKLGPCQVLIVREQLDQPLKEVRYWATSERQADLASVIGWVGQRWSIEQFFADVKELFGTDHYQVRSAKAIVRFWCLCFLGYLYLEEQRARLPDKGAQVRLTIGQTRWHQRKRHQRLLLDWLQARYAEGLSTDQLAQLLAA
jgi:hypothetical protein